MKPGDFLHNTLAGAFPTREVPTERRLGPAIHIDFWILAELTRAGGFSCPARCDAHHIDAVWVNMGDRDVVHGIEIIVLVVFIERGCSGRRCPTTRTASHLHLLLAKLQLSLPECQFPFSQGQICSCRRRSGRHVGHAVTAILAGHASFRNLVIYDQMAELLESLKRRFARYPGRRWEGLSAWWS